MNDIDLIYVPRLLPMVSNPFYILADETCDDEEKFIKKMGEFEAVPSFVPDNARNPYKWQECEAYNFGRVIHFINEIKAGKEIDPITLDCACINGHVLPDPLIIDGWHRFAAHVIAKAPIIRASFSGRVDLLKYLIGKRKTCPQE